MTGATDTSQFPEYRMWLNDERTVLVTLWTASDKMTVALRDDASGIWGPPIQVEERP